MNKERLIEVVQYDKPLQPAITYHLDGSNTGSLPSDIEDQLVGIGGVAWDSSNSTSRSVNFCGFISSKESFRVFLPKTTDLTLGEMVLLSHAKIVFQSILRYSQTSSSLMSGDDPLSRSERDSINQIQLLLNLLQDWRTNGIYSNVKPVVRYVNSGRIDWKRTFTSVLPLISSKGIPLYPHFAVTDIRQQSTTFIGQIHRWAVARADAALGWLLNTEGPTRLFPELSNDGVRLPCSQQMAIGLLKRELRTQYNDRNIWLLKSLIRLMEGSDRIGTDGTYGVIDFWRVWEGACKDVIPYQSETIRKLLPQPVYITEEAKVLRNKARQIPDIMVVRDGTVNVIDAKYYDVGNSLPGWGDIVKQLFYSKSIQLIRVGDKIRNVFLFPAPNSYTDKPSKIILRSNASVTDSELETEFPPIVCAYLDIYTVLESYVRSKTVELLVG
jgi:hypothetical protein